MPQPPDITFAQLNPQQAQRLGVGLRNATAAKAVIFPTGVSLSCPSFTTFGGRNTSRFTISMWVYIPSNYFPMGQQQTIFTFGDSPRNEDIFQYVLKFKDSFAVQSPPAGIGPIPDPADIPLVNINPNLVPPDGNPLWVYYNFGYWHYESVPTTFSNQCRIVVKSAGLFSSVHASFKDTKGVDILFPQSEGFADSSDGRKEIQFKTDAWNWIAFGINTTNANFLPYVGPPMAIPSLPADAASNAPVAYSQVQMWTDKSIAFINPNFAAEFTYRNVEGVYRAQPSILIADMRNIGTLIPGEFAPQAQDAFGRSDILFDGTKDIFKINRGTGPTFNLQGFQGFSLQDFPAGP